ncbi:hypothetical protein Xen7305DRAFT_00025730 [Xenococcus sp. PCC 7305]|uniref:DUF1868 domain-containing protein n=1 Tax=Xenococcus sp. PCC 7305 TaxID=102125 RepID=UPI0002ABEE5B|nr:DUF1868 domain-containing protein [Xenococcus sp. PCC 7305]ELS02855.1 hypothetical protein Xen7305DRAFT_00025730 [Xenococcus sp. PCC 7305]
MNETYQAYINRVAQLTLPATYSTQLQTIQTSPKFVDGQVAYFPGYSVITPTSNEDPTNQGFYSQVQLLQQQLIEQLESDLIIPLPPESFHLTLADLIWGDSYQQAVTENAEFDDKLRLQINHSFQQYKNLEQNFHNVQWQLWGLSIRPRAIMACLAPKDQASYDAIVALRRCLYQNEGLMGLGIEQQYDFTAHITLGYFNQIPTDLNRSQLCIIISQIADRLLDGEPAIINILSGELRKFDNMVNYYRQSDWATISFA